MRTTRILVVDDSAFARKVLRDVFAAHGDLEVVGTARDGLEALEKVAELRPDVMTLDLAMPNLDGVGVLRALGHPSFPRVVVVSTADSESEQGLAALEAGAVELVHKPTALATDRLFDMAGELVAAVRAAAVARAVPVDLGEAHASPRVLQARSKRIVVVGASTGGPNAVARLLKALPAEIPVPIAVVLHLPAGYTGPYAARLDRECRMSVREVEDGMPLEAGVAVIAKAGCHLKVQASRDGLVARTDLFPIDTPHRPAVDVLFATAAAAVGGAALGIVLTGMGDDGLAGSRAIHAAGGEVVTETESSCVVYGMPRSVWEAGLASAEVPLSRMAAELIARL